MPGSFFHDVNTPATGWIALLLLGACTHPSAPAVRTPSAAPRVTQPASGDGCQRAATLQGRAEAELATGNWLRARRLAEQAREVCGSAGHALTEVQARLDASTGEPGALLAAASLARAAGQVQTAREQESAAIALLEKAGSGRLSLGPRWSFAAPQASPEGRYLFLPSDQQLLVLDTQTGQLKTRLPLPPDQYQAAYNAAANRVVVSAVDLSSFATQPDAPSCLSTVAIYDGQSGALLKSECAIHWAFSPDGSRLAIARLLAFKLGSGAVMSAVVLDSRTLEPVLTLSPPLQNGRPVVGNVSGLEFAPDGSTLAVEWASGVSLTDLASGKSEAFPFTSDGTYLAKLAYGGTRAAWREDERVSVWDTSKHHLSSWSVGKCKQVGLVSLSADGARLLANCGDSLTLWDVPTQQLTARVKVPKGVWAYTYDWLTANVRRPGLLVGYSHDTQTETALLDLSSLRWSRPAGPGELMTAFSPASRLAIVRKALSYQSRVVALDTMLRAHDVPMPDCAPTDVVDAKPGLAVVACGSQRGDAAVLVDTTTLATRSYAVGGAELSIQGSVLVARDRTGVELRDLNTGALLPSSPVSPASTRWDGWWDGSAWIAATWSDRVDELRVTHFGSKLTTESEPVPTAPTCAATPGKQSGRVLWQQVPPFAVCDRRTGRELGKLTPAESGAGGIASPLLSDDGELVLDGERPPHLFHRVTGEEVVLKDPPSHAEFSTGHLLAGWDELQQWGFWDADSGARLSRFSVPMQTTPSVASVALGLAIEPAKRLKLIDLASGKELRTLNVSASGDIQLHAAGILTVVEPTSVSFWRLPSGHRIGRWFAHPDADDVAFLAESGEFETSGDPGRWSHVLRCEMGLREVPFQICADAFAESGLAERVLGVGSP